MHKCLGGVPVGWGLQVLGALLLVFPQTENGVGEIGTCGERRSHGELKLLL